MQKLILSDVQLFKTKKDGSQYQGKFGAYFILKVKCDQVPEPITFFINPNSEYVTAKTGDEVWAQLDLPKEYNGVLSRSGRLAKPEDVRLEKMSAALKNLMSWAKGQGFDVSKNY